MYIEITAAVRSIRYWAEAASTDAVFPMTAYNAMLHPDVREELSISQHRLSGNPINVPAFKQISTVVIKLWSRCPTQVNLHSLGWALSHMSRAQQEEIATRLSTSLSTKDDPMKEVPHSIPPDVVERLGARLAALNQALLDKDPMMPKHLQESHRILVSYPESRNLLTDGEIATLIQGAVVHTQTEIVKAKLAPTRKAASKVTVDDL